MILFNILYISTHFSLPFYITVRYISLCHTMSHEIPRRICIKGQSRNMFNNRNMIFPPFKKWFCLNLFLFVVFYFLFFVIYYVAFYYYLLQQLMLLHCKIPQITDNDSKMFLYCTIQLKSNLRFWWCIRKIKIKGVITLTILLMIKSMDEHSMKH